MIPYSLEYLVKLINQWHANPEGMASRVITSAIVGQGVFWLLGSDQIGLFMNPKLRMGRGPSIGRFVYSRLPHTKTTARTVKVIEILTDASRAPLEGALYRRHGITPDAIATLVTQPLWSLIEAAEKIAGVVIHPERLEDDEQVIQSLANIYGNVFRWGLTGAIWAAASPINRRVSKPIEAKLRRTFRGNRAKLAKS